MPKRILIFSLAYYPHVGGAEVAIKEITDRINSSDISFDMVTLRYDRNSPKVEKIGNVTVHRIGWGKANPTASDLVRFPMYFLKVFYPIMAFLKAVSLDRKYRYDGCWAMMSYMLFPIVFLRLFHRPIPYSLTLQEGDPWEHMFGRWFILPFRPLLNIGFRKAKIVQTISTYLVTWAKTMGYKGVIEVIPNGVDLSVFTNFPKFGSGLKSFIESKQPYYVNLITTSRLVKKNAVEDIIKAVEILVKEDKREAKTTYKLFVFGDGPLKQDLEQMVEQRGIQENIKFRGHRTHQEIIGDIKEEMKVDLMNVIFIFIRPSLSEGMGNSFIEAMAAGLPVVATQEGGIADFLFDKKRNPDKVSTGWAVDKNSPEQIAKAVKEIISNPDEMLRTIDNAKKMVMEKYDWNIIAKDMKEKVFDKIFELKK